jgi:DNA modification methylase
MSPIDDDDICSGEVLHLPALELLRQQPTGSVGAIVTDPPFFISTKRDGGGMGDDPWAKDVSSTDAMVEWYLPLAHEAFRVIRPGGACVVMGGAHSISAWQVAADRAGLVWMADLVVLWNTGKPRMRNFGGLHTSVRWHVRPGSRHVFNGHRAIYSNILVCSKIPVHHRQHVTQKPVELTNFLVSLLTEPDDLIVDPFCGSGSTLVSAAMCNRRWLGGDVDIDYCRIAQKRALEHEMEDELPPIWLWHNGKMREV